MAEEQGIDFGNIDLNDIKTVNEMLADAAAGQSTSAPATSMKYQMILQLPK